MHLKQSNIWLKGEGPKKTIIILKNNASISLEKIKYEAFHGKVLFKTPKYNDYFKENFRTFDALDFIAEVTAHIPPKNKQYIRRYGCLCKAKDYASRTRGIWDRSPHIVKLAPEGWKEKHIQSFDPEVPLPETQEYSQLR